MVAGPYAGALLLGLVSGLHCVTMCGALGGALCGGAETPAFRAWNLARIVSYAAAGALTGGGSALLASGASRHPALQSLWVMLQLTALAIALLMLLRPRQIGWMALAGQSGWQPVHGPGRLPPLRRSFTGLLWAGFPCGLLHAALLLAWMSGSAVDGAFVMLLFGLASGAWLLTGSAWLQRLRRSAGWSELQVRRLAGAALLLGWVAMAAGLLDGAGHWAQAGLFCAPPR